MLRVREQVGDPVVRSARGALPDDVRGDSRPDDRRPVLGAVAGRTGAMRVEAVAERSARAVGEEAVLAPPTGSVARAEGVDVEVPPEAVERAAGPRRVEAVDACPAVGERSVQVLVSPVGPVELDRQHGQRARPVREMELPDRLAGRRRDAVVRKAALPRLQRPEGAVRRSAGRDEPGERRSLVGAAGAAEALPVVAAVLAVAPGVVEPELDLLAGRRRRERVDGSPGQDVLHGARRPVAEQGLPSAVDRERD